MSNEWEPVTFKDANGVINGLQAPDMPMFDDLVITFSGNMDEREYAILVVLMKRILKNNFPGHDELMELKNKMAD